MGGPPQQQLLNLLPVRPSPRTTTTTHARNNPPPLPCHPPSQVKLGEFNTIKSQISAALRKAGGSLAVRDIGGLVKPGQLVDSENLTTLFVVVSKYSVKDWESCYEKLADFVVSRLSVVNM